MMDASRSSKVVWVGSFPSKAAPSELYYRLKTKRGGPQGKPRESHPP